MSTPATGMPARPRVVVATLLAVLLGALFLMWAPPARAAGSGVLNVTMTPINLSTGDPITDASNGTNGNQITYRVQYSCTTAACDNTQVQFSPAPPDPNGLLPDGEWILEYSTWVPPVGGGTISGDDTTGKLIDLGNLNAGSSGTFSVTYGYQSSRNREVPNGSFYPDGFQIAMSAVAASDTAVAPVTANAPKVTWHIGTPTGPTGQLAPNNGTFKTDVEQTLQVAVDPGNMVVNPGSNVAGSADLVATGDYKIVYSVPPEAHIVSVSRPGGSDPDAVIDNTAHTITWTKGSAASPSYGARGGWGINALSGFNSGGPGVNNNLVGDEDDAFWGPRTITVVFDGSAFPDADANGCNFNTPVTSHLDVTVNYLDTARTEATLSKDVNARVACTSPFAGVQSGKSIANGISSQFEFGDGNLGNNVYAVNVPAPGETDTANREWRVTASNLGNEDATAVIDEPDLVQDHLKVYRIFAYAYAGAPAGWQATVNWTDNTGATGTAQLGDGASVAAATGRWFVSATATAPLAAGRILPTDNTSTSMRMGYRFHVDDSAPIGTQITNTAHVTLNYPADPDGDGTPDTYDDLQGNPSRRRRSRATPRGSPGTRSRLRF
jgi:hypothetical protein